VDGQTLALTNTAPYRVTVPRDRLIEGEHTAKIIVLTRDGKEPASSEILSRWNTGGISKTARLCGILTPRLFRTRKTKMAQFQRFAVREFQ
jgi:hypothetical protein